MSLSAWQPNGNRHLHRACLTMLSLVGVRPAETTGVAATRGPVPRGFVETMSGRKAFAPIFGIAKLVAQL